MRHYTVTLTNGDGDTILVCTTNQPEMIDAVSWAAGIVKQLQRLLGHQVLIGSIIDFKS